MKLNEKILAVQTEIGALSKDKKNPFFKSSYFDINQIISQLMPLLEKHKLTVVQPLSHVEGRPAITTMVADAEVEGCEISSTMILPDIADPQKMGSAITYFRRYSLQSFFLLQAEDDDANFGAGKTKSMSTGNDLLF